MPRLIDANKLIIDIVHKYGRSQSDAILEIAEAPTVDAIPVVHCKDCMHYKYENHLIGEPVDPPYGFCGTINRYIPEAFYCAYGERREDDI